MLLKPEFDPPVKSVEEFMERNMTLGKYNIYFYSQAKVDPKYFVQVISSFFFYSIISINLNTFCDLTVLIG